MTDAPPPGYGLSASPRGRAALSGVLLFAAGAHPSLAPISFVALVPWLLHLGRPAEAARSGWVLGLVFWGLNLSWGVALVPRIDALWPALAWLGQVLVLALATAGAGALVAALASRHPLWLSAGLGWLAVEWGRGALLGPLNFPWTPLGLPLVHLAWWGQPAAWVGGVGLSCGVAAVNGLLAGAGAKAPGPARGRWRPVVAAVAAVALWGASGAARLAVLHPGPVVRAGVLQPGIPLDPSRPAEEAEALALAALERLDDAGNAELVVLPETLFPAAPGEGARRGEPRWSPGVDAALREAARRVEVPIVTGAYSAGVEGDRNAVFLVAPDEGEGVAPVGGRERAGASGPRASVALLHEKEALVPGVEWLPAGGLERGGATFTGAGPASPGILVCIESAWSGIARRHTLAGARWLVNVTNDAWLSGPGGGFLGFAFRQHPAHLQLRSVETGLGALRVGTTGLTGVTDPAGRWTPLLDPHRPGVAAASVASLPGTTIFVRYGGWLAPVLSLAAVLAALSQRLPRSGGPVDQGSSRV